MNQLLVAAVLAALKKYILDSLSGFKAKLPDMLKPAVDQFATWITALLDSVDLAALEQSAIGNAVALIQKGSGPSSSSPVDLA